VDAGVLANWAGVVSVWVAIASFWSEKRRERREREYGTYHALDEKYSEYLTLCAARPELDLYFVPHPSPPALDPAQHIAQLAQFEILVSLFERAFLMYQDHPSRVRATQWEGWERCLREWVRRPIFGLLWQRIGSAQFDQEFVAYMTSAHGMPAELKEKG
jgi:hypothetical protein